MKKLMMMLMGLILIGVGLFVAFRVITGRSVTSGLDEWVARQVVKIGNTYLEPQIAFDSFAFNPPGTLDLKGVTMTAPDGTEVVRAGVLRVTLAELPSMNQPITIEKITLIDASLRVIKTATGFKGLSPFVKGEVVANPDAVAEDVKLSRVMKIRELSLENGTLEYDDGSGSPPMKLEGLTLAMQVNPEGGDGWYAIDTKSTAGGGSLAELSLKGEFNVDSLDAKLERVALSMMVDESTYGVLPPSVQQSLRQYDARGKLDAEVSGDASLKNFAASRLMSEVRVKDFNIASGDYRVPIDSAVFPVTISEGRATMPEGKIELLGGTVRVRDLQSDFMQTGMQTRLGWQAERLDLQKMLRVATPSGQPPKLAGIVQSSGSVSMSGSDALGTIDGSGDLTLREGRLVNIPLIKEFAEVMKVFTQASSSTENNSTVDARFDLKPQGVVITEASVETPVANGRGTGTVGYTGNLDLMVNAGPVEKVQGMLGKVGDVIGKVTDNLVKYHVTGVVGDPQISVKPFGL